MRGQRIVALLALAGALILGKVAQQVYRWYAFREERAQLGALRVELVDAGADLFRVQARLDTLHREIAREDSVLRVEERRVTRYDRYARDGQLTEGLYSVYRRDLDRYNEHVRGRNARFEAWRRTIGAESVAVARYNLLSDSVSRIAARMGDPYYPIPRPVEAAAERGIVHLDAPRGPAPKPPPGPASPAEPPR